MRTEVNRNYKFGFILTEQDARRIAQTCQEHAAKLGADKLILFSALLKDGSCIESNNIDDIVGLENGGSKSINRIQMIFTDNLDQPKSGISVRLENALLNPRSWSSVIISVSGESRDSVFVAAADLDERIRKTRTVAWSYLFSTPWFYMGSLILTMTLMLFLLVTVSLTKDAVDSLEQEYTAGKIKNPTEAIIFFERAKSNSSSIIKRLSISVLPIFSGWTLLAIISFTLPKMTPSYVFCWGDSLATYERRKTIVRYFWSAIVIGIFVSIIAGLILRLI